MNLLFFSRKHDFILCFDSNNFVKMLSKLFNQCWKIWMLKSRSLFDSINLLDMTFKNGSIACWNRMFRIRLSDYVSINADPITIRNLLDTMKKKEKNKSYLNKCWMDKPSARANNSANLQFKSLDTKDNSTLWSSTSLLQSDHKRIIQDNIGSLYSFSTICSLVTQ